MNNFVFLCVTVFAIAMILNIYKIYYDYYIYTNFPKGTWVKSMQKPIYYDGKTLCAHLHRKNRKTNWNCISANIDTILHNIDGDFVYDCNQNRELCIMGLEKAIFKHFIEFD